MGFVGTPDFRSAQDWSMRSLDHKLNFGVFFCQIGDLPKNLADFVVVADR